MTDIDAINIREKLAHIDLMLSDNQRISADIRRIDADHDRKRQEIRYQPIIALISGLTAGAALIVAGAALMKFFG